MTYYDELANETREILDYIKPPPPSKNVFFRNAEIQVYEEKKDPSCGLDNYGKPLKCNVPVGTVDGDFQPMSVSEQLHEYGRIVQGRYKVYLPPDLNIHERMKFVINGQTYQVEGIPEKRTTLTPTSHQKVYLQLEG